MFDGSSIRGFKRIEQSDMYFHPDLDTFRCCPWRGTESGQGRTPHLRRRRPRRHPVRGRPAREPEAGARRGTAEGYDDAGRARGRVLPLQAERGRRQPTIDPHDDAVYFDVGPDDLGEDTRRDIEDTLHEMGFDLEASHHEVAIGQHEIDFRHADALTCADNLITFRWVVKVIAASHGMHATFMPKPIYGENGSGMHINQSLTRGEAKRLLRPERRAAAVRGRLRLHRGPDGAPAGHHGRSRTRRSTRTSGCCPATRRRSTSRGRPATARPRSACRPSAGARPVPSCARPIRPRTPTSRSRPWSRRASTACAAACARRRR